MPQQQAVNVENSFVNGVVTEATALNFPDKAVTEADNCIFDIDGSVYRRTGFDWERDFKIYNIDRNNKVINTYLWQNVAGNGNVTIAVVQIGDVLYFYETNGSGSFSPGVVASSVGLAPVAGAPDPDTVEAQFCDGNGYLIVTHPYCEPIRISYDIDNHVATPVNLRIKVRDFEGVTADPYAVDERPVTTLAGMDPNHYYNLLNQGWNGTNLAAWDTNQTTMPSNADVMWSFVDSSGDFDSTSAAIARVIAGNTPAPNGHYIGELALFDRNALTGIVPTLPKPSTGFQRPSVCAFFSGRVFYAGINAVGYNSNIYFTQIIEGLDQYEKCYQVNDPTAENLFDLLPSDGGVISIPEAGTIYKMLTIPGGLCIFAANGVWFLTGSTGLGFTATDYAMLKVADISSISGTSFVNVAGYPAWWNSEGIYLVQPNNSGAIPSVKSLTYDTFKTFYDGIPIVSKRFARGFFDKTDGHIRWLYRKEATTQLEATYEYDGILNYNVRTNAFYPWSVDPTHPIKIHSIISTELVTRAVNIVNVVDSSLNNVVDSNGNQVIVYTESGNDNQQFDKYFVSNALANSTLSTFTFADRIAGNYSDWLQYDNKGRDYLSYFITGFKLAGQGVRKFQANWVNIYSRLEETVKYNFQALWDFANQGDLTGRWSNNQVVAHDDLKYSNATKRLKTRGHGKALQFRVSSIKDEPFDIIGWTSVQSTNGAP